METGVGVGGGASVAVGADTTAGICVGEGVRIGAKVGGDVGAGAEAGVGVRTGAAVELEVGAGAEVGVCVRTGMEVGVEVCIMTATAVGVAATEGTELAVGVGREVRAVAVAGAGCPPPQATNTSVAATKITADTVARGVMLILLIATGSSPSGRRYSTLSHLGTKMLPGKRNPKGQGLFIVILSDSEGSKVLACIPFFILEPSPCRVILDSSSSAQNDISR